MQILITGVTSFLGKATAKALLKRGHKVIGVVRPGSRNEAVLQDEGLEKLNIVHFDFDELPDAEEGKYRELCHESEESPLLYPEMEEEDTDFSKTRKEELSALDCWIHFAWDGIGSKGRQDRRIQERNIANAQKAYFMAKALGAKKFLFAGSQAEYGKGNHEAPNPISEYGKAKLRFGRWAMERSENDRTREEEMQFLHLRIYSVYGYGDHPTTLTNTLTRACLNGTEFSLGPCTQNWNYLEIRDFSEALSLLVESPDTKSGIVDIAGEETKALRDYVLKAAEALLSGISDPESPLYSLYINYKKSKADGENNGVQRETKQEGRIKAVPSTGFMLHFGVRANNAEGNAGMNPDISTLKNLEFQQKIPFSKGMLELAEKILRSES